MKTINDYSLITEKLAAKMVKAADNYHQNAEIQAKVAEGLMASLRPWKNILPRKGALLEVGCGTGLLSKLLIKEFPEREIVLTDLNQEILDICKSNLEQEGLLSDKITFEVLEVNNTTKLEPDSNAMVISNFVPHWFKDTSIGLERLSDSIVYGGLLLCSFPGNKSFPEWYEKCLELGLPFTSNSLPDTEEVVVKLSMANVQVDYHENELTQQFDTALDFFKHLKNIGIDVSNNDKHLTSKQLRLLTNYWDEKSEGYREVTWHIIYLAAKKE